jgi:hypothetical protein
MRTMATLHEYGFEEIKQQLSDATRLPGFTKKKRRAQLVSFTKMCQKSLT